MQPKNNPAPEYVYTYACHEDEQALCRLEFKQLFGSDPHRGLVVSPVEQDPSRSPFVKQRITVELAGDTLEQLAEQAKSLELGGATFKIQYAGNGGDVPIVYEEERAIERLIGANVRGKAEMRTPERRYGVVRGADGSWRLGLIVDNEAVWLQHRDKPRQYSTALTTRVARAVCNIAAPRPQGIRVIDPCCGMGTVLIEALSMGFAATGCDVNPLAVEGARDNLAHFGYPDVVALRDMREVTESYDAAIVDLPYNLCSVLSELDQLELLTAVRRFARRAVLISTQPIDRPAERVGFRIADRCEVRKGRFVRHVLLCE